MQMPELNLKKLKRAANSKEEVVVTAGVLRALIYTAEAGRNVLKAGQEYSAKNAAIIELLKSLKRLEEEL